MAVSDSDEEESFVVIGTALEVPDEDIPRKKKIHVEDLPVRDSSGRTRFHGAFTGGFSAGYFNTAGSKEGWTPSSFTSSRSLRAENTQQQPEDYMDDEDLGEHGIAPRSLFTTEGFGSTHAEASRKRVFEAADPSCIIPVGKLFADLMIPDVAPIGIRLLRQMGWRDGQGLGPRRKNKLKQKVLREKVYGCSLPTTNSEPELSEGEADMIKDFTFAPKDTTPIDFTPKENCHGIGFSGLNPRLALQSGHFNLFETESSVCKTGGRQKRGQGFGVGALEDEDDDIYSVDNVSDYHQTLGDLDEYSRFGWTAPKNRDIAIQGQSASSFSTVLEGFQLSSKKLAQKKVFPVPCIPQNYKAFHTESPNLPVESTYSPAFQTQNSISRGLLLEELPIMGPASLATPPGMDSKLHEAQKTSQKTSRFSDVNEDHLVSETVQSSSSLCHLPASENRVDSSSRYKPFSKDPTKQTRYEQYLSLLKLGIKDPYGKLSAGKLTDWEREREKEEFMRSAILYKPMSAIMASQFTTAQFQDDSYQVTASGQEDVAIGDDVKAAEMKMFGKLTREVLEWHPDKILCKRFNVPDPYPESQIVGLPGSRREKFSVFSFIRRPLESASTFSGRACTSATCTSHIATESNTKAKTLGKELTNQNTPKKSTANIFATYFEEEDKGRSSRESEQLTNSAVDTLMSEELTQANANERPPMDLFKAIFQDSDSDESSVHEEKEDNEKPPKVLGEPSLDSNVSSVGEGEMPHTTSTNDQQAQTVRIPSLEERLFKVDAPVSDHEEDLFGPCLPPQLLNSKCSSAGFRDISQEAEGERFGNKTTGTHRKHKHIDGETSSHKHGKHKDKKSKHKKKKKKEKKKTHKRRNSVNSGYEASTSEKEEDCSEPR